MKIFTIIIIWLMAILFTLFWHKKINPETTWIYGIYALTIIIILSVFVYLE